MRAYNSTRLYVVTPQRLVTPFAPRSHSQSKLFAAYCVLWSPNHLSHNNTYARVHCELICERKDPIFAFGFELRILDCVVRSGCVYGRPIKMQAIRHIASRDRHRYHQDQYDLDLTCILCR